MQQRSGGETGVRPPVPPFDEESARQKVKAAQDAWNTRDPEKVALAYTEDSEWRNRDEFFEGRDADVGGGARLLAPYDRARGPRR